MDRKKLNTLKQMGPILSLLALAAACGHEKSATVANPSPTPLQTAALSGAGKAIVSSDAKPEPFYVSPFPEDMLDVLGNVQADDKVAQAKLEKLLTKPADHAQYCAAAADLLSFQRWMYAQSQRVAYPDSDVGPLGIGLCWWESRLQRSANYLAVFKGRKSDAETKPTIEEISSYLDTIAANESVVEIPYYRDLQELSTEHKNDVISKKLNSWFIRDSLAFQWVHGFEGSSTENSGKFAAQMNELYLHVNGFQQMTFALVQLPGLGTHAWLVNAMKRTDTGYLLDVVDGNFSNRTLQVKYEFGDEFLSANSLTNATDLKPDFAENGKFTVMLQRDDEMKDILNAVFSYCQPELAKDKWYKNVLKEYNKVKGANQSRDPNYGRREVLALALRKFARDHVIHDYKNLILEDEDLKPTNWNSLMTAIVIKSN